MTIVVKAAEVSPIVRHTFDFHGLYAITDSTLIPSAHLTDAVDRAIAGGAKVIQYRDKSHATARRRHEAAQLRECCARHDVCFIVNDDVELARQTGADGVHIGADDGSIAAARALLGEQAVIGVSCYNRLANAEQAVAEGADYVAFGRFFPSRTKPDAVTATPELLTRARGLSCPVVAIGGITPDNGRALVVAGATMLAVVDGVFGQVDIENAARTYADLFS